MLAFTAWCWLLQRGAGEGIVRPTSVFLMLKKGFGLLGQVTLEIVRVSSNI